MDNGVLLSILISALLVLLMFTIMQILIRNINESKKNTYDFEKDMVRYDQMRNYYEQKLHDMNEKLAADKERWITSNHLIISGNESTLDKENLKNRETSEAKFLLNHGLTKEDLKVERLEVFVLTSFLEEQRYTYEVIKNTCEMSGLICSRSDENYIENDILKHILRRIAKARIIIANIDGRNSNVFYELGIAHALDKPTIMISKSKNKVPFDLQSKNILFYTDEDDLSKKLTIEINKTILNKEINW